MEDIALTSLPKGPDSEVNSENGSILLNGGNLASEPETDSDEDNNAQYFNQSVAYGIREKNGNVTTSNDRIIGFTPRYACPFFKHNPQKYGSRSSCSGPGWESVYRVKYVTYKRLGKYG